MALLLKLQDFAPTGDDGSDTFCVETLLGYGEGFAAGHLAATRNAANIDETLVKSLDDLAFGFAEARRAILQGLKPLFVAIVDHIIPQTAAASHHAHIIAQLTYAASIDAAQPIILTINPVNSAAIQAVLDRQNNTDIKLSTNSSQPENTALISRGDVETVLDTAEVVNGMTQILTDFYDVIGQDAQHG